jgi:hypothetical protein
MDGTLCLQYLIAKGSIHRRSLTVHQHESILVNLKVAPLIILNVLY